MPDDDLLDDDGSPPAPTLDFDRSDLDSVLQQISGDDKKWRAGKPLDLGGTFWKPHLTRGRDHLHVHLATELMPYLVDRFTAARQVGHQVHIALPLPALCDDGLAELLAPIEPMVHVLHDGRLSEPEPLLIVLGRRWRVSPPTRTAVGLVGWELVKASGTAKEKGVRLESLLCFLLGQMADFEVSEVDLRTATEELDIIVTVRANTRMCWVIPGAPFVLVEAKNWHTQPVGQKDASAFLFQATHKRDTCRIGVMVGTLGFTADAKQQTLRAIADKFTLALLGPAELEAWINADDGDAEFEKLIRRAMLN